MNQSPSFFPLFDLIATALIIMIGSLGVLFIYSATYTVDQPYSLFFKKQLIGLLSGLLIYAVTATISYRSMMRFGYFGYLLLIALLCFTLLKGTIGMGAQRWLNLFFIKIQPSELAKWLFPACAAYCIRLYDSQNKVLLYFLLLGLCSISFLLIVKQPDLGTALILLGTGAVMMWLAGVPTKYFLYALLVAGLCTPLIWKSLKPYQRNRIAVFLGYGSTHKERYQLEQAAIAIGSGGLFGKGFLNGTQGKLRFLPESRTDFIFAVMSEEWGFIGAMLMLLLYILLYIRLLLLTLSIPESTIQIFAIGLLIPIMLSTIINIGMVLGLAPVVGIPLPLMSYGLSNLWVTCASLGCIQNALCHPSEFYYFRQPTFE